jgi:teichuronic acid biosynthesis glycosyltransferase TuaG
MPAYNAGGHLARAIASVRAQTREDWELIIIDDGSTDDTHRIAKRWAVIDPRIVLLDQPLNSGAAQARNRALLAARGRFIAFLDADDEWHPEKLAAQLDFMAEHKAAFSFTAFWRERAGHLHLVQAPASVTRACLLRGNRIGCLTVVFDRDRLGLVQMPDLRLRQDYATWLDLLDRTESALGLDMPLATLHQRAGSLSSDKVRAMLATWRVYRLHAHLSTWQAVQCLASHLVGRLIRG